MTKPPLIENYFKMFRNYANFSGRASRGEYWWAFLMNYVVIFGIRMITSFLSTIIMIGSIGSDTSISGFLVSLLSTGIYLLYSLFALIPMMSLQVRRLHDINRSGWWMLLSYTGIGAIILLVWFCQPGTEDTNLFGSDPHPIRQY